MKINPFLSLFLDQKKKILRKLNLFVNSVTLRSNTKELIPTDVVEFLDASDQIGVNTSIPPRFDCQKCFGKMVPTYYISVNGIVFKI